MVRLRSFFVIAATVTSIGGAPAAALEAQSNVAVVHRLMLDEEMVILPSDGSERVAELADILDHEDFIATSPNTRAAVRFTDDGSLLRVNPNSQVHIRAEGEAGSTTKRLELEFGELWARVEGREGSEFEVETPSGVAAVRGTEFIVGVGADGETTVITLEGLLDFFNDTGTVEVPEGFVARTGASDEEPVVEPTDDDALQTYAELAEDDPEPDDDLVEIEIPGVDAQGQPTTLQLQVPRDQAESLLNIGGLP